MSKTKAKGGVSALALIDANIKYVRTVGRNVQERIHDTAVLIVEHAAQHGDCSRALALVQAMPKGQRRSMLVKWFGKYSPIAVNITGDVKKDSVRLRKSDSKAYNAFNARGGKAVPWYTLEPEQMPDTSWDAEKVNSTVVSMAERLQKRLDEGKIDDEARERTVELIERLKAA